MSRAFIEELIKKTAAMMSAQTGERMSGAVDVQFQAIEDSIADQAALSELLNAEVDAGHLDMITAHQRRNPGISREAAVKDLQRIAEVNEVMSELLGGSDVAAPTPTSGGSDEGSVQQTALNGAQATTLTEILDRVTRGQTAPAVAELIIQSAFPAFDETRIKAMVAKSKAFTPREEAPSE